MFMEKKRLKITVLNQLNNLKWLLILSVLYCSVVYFLFGNSLNENSLKIFLVAFLFIGSQAVITAYVHISYFIRNRNSNFEVLNNTIVDHTKNRIINNSDIQKIVVYKSYSLTSGKIPFFPFQHYRYCEVVLKNEEKIFLTSLLCNTIDEYLKMNIKGVVFESNNSPFCYFL
jgi:hypothetical protein